MEWMRGRYARLYAECKKDITITYELIEKILEESIKYIEQNWKKFAYVDNPDCAAVKVDKIEPIHSLFVKIGHNPSLRNSLIIELIDRLSQKYEIVDIGYSKVGRERSTYIIYICKR